MNSYPNTLMNDHETTTALVSDGIERYQTNKQDIYDKNCFLFAFLNDRIPEHQQHRRASTNTDTECAESSKQVLETDTQAHIHSHMISISVKINE